MCYPHITSLPHFVGFGCLFRTFPVGKYRLAEKYSARTHAVGYAIFTRAAKKTEQTGCKYGLFSPKKHYFVKIRKIRSRRYPFHADPPHFLTEKRRFLQLPIPFPYQKNDVHCKKHPTFVSAFEEEEERN
jgi:hypothetical protein